MPKTIDSENSNSRRREARESRQAIVKIKLASAAAPWPLLDLSAGLGTHDAPGTMAMRT